MSIALVKTLESKTAALKKAIPEGRKALRFEMSALYGKIAASQRRRAADSWRRPL